MRYINQQTLIYLNKKKMQSIKAKSCIETNFILKYFI